MSTELQRASKSPASSDPAPHRALPLHSNQQMRSLVGAANTSSGRPLAGPVRSEMEHSFGRPLDNVRVHTEGLAAAAAKSAGAEAVAAGSDIVFGKGRYAPETMRGRNLLAHELTHVVQQAKGRDRAHGAGDERRLEAEADAAARDVLHGRPAQVASTGTARGVQFRIRPEQVGSEMVGMTFALTKSITVGRVTVGKGDQVKIAAWDIDAQHRTRVKVLTGKAKGQTVVLPETAIRPVSPSATGVAQYSAGVDAQSAAVEKSEAKLTAWQANKAAHKTAPSKKLYAVEEARLSGLVERQRDVLNRRQIQQAMFNRFDSVIEKEVRNANAAHGLKAADALDPNLVKAQLFQESQLGTAGEHLQDPPLHPVKSRFNLGQVIDSSALALLTLFENEHQSLLKKFGIENLRKDLIAAQSRFAVLRDKQKKGALTTAEDAELTGLEPLSQRNWEEFIWLYRPTGKTHGFREAVNDFFSSSSPAKNLDYEFWIHLAVFWLFEKKTKGRTWEDTIKAYNGGGQAAEDYKKAVVKRAADAASASKAGGSLTPTNI